MPLGKSTSNVSPALNWTQIPSSAQSLVLIVRDIDAPGGDFIHWAVKNISPTTTGVAQNSIPTGGIEVPNDFGISNYSGPCPPSGTHRYQFELYALNVATMAETTVAQLEANMQANILKQNILTASYTYNP